LAGMFRASRCAGDRPTVLVRGGRLPKLVLPEVTRRREEYLPPLSLRRQCPVHSHRRYPSRRDGNSRWTGAVGKGQKSWRLERKRSRRCRKDIPRGCAGRERVRSEVAHEEQRSNVGNPPEKGEEGQRVRCRAARDGSLRPAASVRRTFACK